MELAVECARGRIETEYVHTTQVGFDLRKYRGGLVAGVRKRQATGFAREAIETVADRLGDGARRKKPCRARVLNGINHQSGGLCHFDDVVQANIAAGVETIGKYDDRFSPRDGL